MNDCLEISNANVRSSLQPRKDDNGNLRPRDDPVRFNRKLRGSFTLSADTIPSILSTSSESNEGSFEKVATCDISRKENGAGNSNAPNCGPRKPRRGSRLSRSLTMGPNDDFFALTMPTLSTDAMDDAALVDKLSDDIPKASELPVKTQGKFEDGGARSNGSRGGHEEPVPEDISFDSPKRPSSRRGSRRLSLDSGLSRSLTLGKNDRSNFFSSSISALSPPKPSIGTRKSIEDGVKTERKPRRRSLTLDAQSSNDFFAKTEASFADAASKKPEPPANPPENTPPRRKPGRQRGGRIFGKSLTLKENIFTLGVSSFDSDDSSAKSPPKPIPAKKVNSFPHDRFNPSDLGIASVLSDVSIDEMEEFFDEKPNKTKGVQFDTVTFREYPIILGDSPSATGVPISIDWQHDPEATISLGVDEYELSRPEGSTRTKSELVIPAEIRKAMLLGLGFTEEEMSGVEQNGKAKAKTDKGRWPKMIPLKMDVDDVDSPVISSKKEITSASKTSKISKKVNFNSDVSKVDPFDFDWDCAGDVWYTMDELNKMNELRLEDAKYLKKQRGLLAQDLTSKASTAKSSTPSDSSSDGLKSEKESSDETTDAKDSKTNAEATAKENNRSEPNIEADLNALITHAFSDPDLDPETTIRGVEHFVYPLLQKEMIRRKKLVKAEVLQFVKLHKEGKKIDPQGWRLAQRSREMSQWAKEVALVRGMRSGIVKREESLSAYKVKCAYE